MKVSDTLISDIHRLWHKGVSARKIARQLGMGRDTVRKYLRTPWRAPAVPHPRASKLDAYKEDIETILRQEDGAEASAVVILAQLRLRGYDGGVSILRDHLRKRRPPKPASRAYVRIEPGPGLRADVDWGHFGVLEYDGFRRKLYAFVLVEAHSRLLYLEFTHSQTFETFARCHLNAFRFLCGITREVYYDNLATAVAEHDGRLVRFQPRFLAFTQELGFVPRACNKAAGWEKGKVERAIGYIRQNFWPLRHFADLADANRQAGEWLRETANRRTHRETGETPAQRFRPEELLPLPDPLPDYRDSVSRLAHKDIRIHFDGNRYCVPPRYAGLQLTVLADSHAVDIFHDGRPVVSYPRCFGHGQTFGAERFEKELLDQLPGAAVSVNRKRLLGLLGPEVDDFLRSCVDNHRALRRQVDDLLRLSRLYGPDAVREAVADARRSNAFGADYVEAILRRQADPRPVQPPVELKNPALARLVPPPPSLSDYDAFILAARSES